MNLPCPQCSDRGKILKAITLNAQVKQFRREQIIDLDGWKLCGSPECNVIYFRQLETIVVGETHSIPFHKSMESNRFVCFCFEHTVEEVKTDFIRNGTSSIQDAIKTACKLGKDDCKRKNPQGRCCLGNVGGVLKDVGTQQSKIPDQDCCSEKTNEPKAHPFIKHSKLLATMGAVFTAILSSMCCWVPLLAIAFGASTLGMAAILETWRIPLLIVSVGCLGVAFFLTYRTPKKTSGRATNVKRLNQITLWVATVFVVIFTFFPRYIEFWGKEAISAPVPTLTQTTSHYHVVGMTCGGCEVHVRNALKKIPDVASVKVSYHKGTATIIWTHQPTHEAVFGALNKVGYSAKLKTINTHD